MAWTTEDSYIPIPPPHSQRILQKKSAKCNHHTATPMNAICPHVPAGNGPWFPPSLYSTMVRENEGALFGPSCPVFT